MGTNSKKDPTGHRKALACLNTVCVSIVSHGHGGIVRDLIGDLCRCSQVSQILLTQNIPESAREKFPPKVKLQTNARPWGYGTNHNAAFRFCQASYFCVINPDIRIHKNPFPALLRAMKDQNVGVCAPRIMALDGDEEDSHRRFPNLGALLGKAFGGSDGRVQAGQAKAWEQNSWLGGMFLLLRSDVFREAEGFDPKFFLYYEDVDLCARLIRTGYWVRKVSSVGVVHDARRQSRRSPRYAAWHLQSMARYFWKRWIGRYTKSKVSLPPRLSSSR